MILTKAFYTMAVLAVLMLGVCVVLGIVTAWLERRILRLHKKLREMKNTNEEETP